MKNRRQYVKSIEMQFKKETITLFNICLRYTIISLTKDKKIGLMSFNHKSTHIKLKLIRFTSNQMITK